LREGEQKGLREGERKGLREGERKGKLEVAKNLLGKKVSAGDIADVTGLSLEEVKNLEACQAKG
jgi:predicted transposase/invertase (TIGR01784 family)